MLDVGEFVDEIIKFSYYCPNSDLDMNVYKYRFDDDWQQEFVNGDPVFLRFKSYILKLPSKNGIIPIEDGSIDKYILENNIIFDLKGKAGFFNIGRLGLEENEIIYYKLIKSVEKSNNPLFALILYLIPTIYHSYRFHEGDYMYPITCNDPVISTLIFFTMRIENKEFNLRDWFTENIQTWRIDTSSLVPYIEEDYSLTELIREVRTLSVLVFGDDILIDNKDDKIAEGMLKQSLCSLRFHIIFDNKCNVKINYEDFVFAIKDFRISIAPEDFDKFDFKIDDYCVLKLLGKNFFNNFIYEYIIENEKYKNQSFKEHLKRHMYFDNVEPSNITKLEKEYFDISEEIDELKHKYELKKEAKLTKYEKNKKKYLRQIKSAKRTGYKSKKIPIEIKEPTFIYPKELTNLEEKLEQISKTLKYKKRIFQNNLNISPQKNLSYFTNILNTEFDETTFIYFLHWILKS